MLLELRRYVVLSSGSLIHHFAEIHGPFSCGSPLPRVDERRRNARSAKGKSARGDLRSAVALLLGRTPTPGRGRALAAAVGAIGEKRTVGEGWGWEEGGWSASCVVPPNRWTHTVDERMDYLKTGVYRTLL